jgi:hypothetical protein
MDPLVAKRLILPAVLCAIALGGCAAESAHREAKGGRSHVVAAAERQAELRIRRANPELLAPLSAPDCDFTKANVSTVDPNQWERLKLDYERRCYKDAEQTARDRLRRLQTVINRGG